MSVIEPTPADPRAAEAAAALAAAARRAVRRDPENPRVAVILARGLGDLADLAAGRRPSVVVATIKQRTAVLLDIARGGEGRPDRPRVSGPRRLHEEDEDGE